MWHLWSPSKLIMPNRLNVATGSSGISNNITSSGMYILHYQCAALLRKPCAPFTTSISRWIVFEALDLSFLTRCLQRPWFCLEPQRHWVCPSIWQEKAHSFVMPTDITPRPDLWSSSPPGAQLPANVLLAWRLDLCTNIALWICLRKLLGRTVDRLLQSKGHGKRKRKYKQSSSSSNKKKKRLVILMVRIIMMMMTVMMKMCKVCVAINIFQKTSGREMGALQKVFLLVPRDLLCWWHGSVNPKSVCVVFLSC